MGGGTYAENCFRNSFYNGNFRVGPPCFELWAKSIKELETGLRKAENLLPDFWNCCFYILGLVYLYYVIVAYQQRESWASPLLERVSYCMCCYGLAMDQ